MKSNFLTKLCLVAISMFPVSLWAQSQTTLSFADYAIKGGETKVLTINLNNPDMNVTALQFNMVLSEGLSIKKTGDNLNASADKTRWTITEEWDGSKTESHTGKVSAQEDGSALFLLSSQDNVVLTGTEGPIFKVQLTAASTFESGTITLKNIKIVAPDESAVTPDNVELKVGENTAVEGITVDKIVSSDVYDLSGRRVRANASSLEGLSKGVYLMNGKKVVKN